MSTTDAGAPGGPAPRLTVLEPRTDPRGEGAGSRSPWSALWVVLIGAFMAILDTFIVLIAAPAIQADLHASGAEIQLILAGYQLVYAVALITGARLGDMFGRKRLFMSGIALFTLSSVACALAPTAGSLIGARLVQGFSAALMFPQVFALIQVLLPPDRRHRAFGALGAVIGISTIMGQLVGGVLVNADLFGMTWRPVFWVNVPIGLVTLVLGAILVPESRSSQTRRLDIPGVAVLTVALALLVVPLIVGRQAGWPAWAWLSLAASMVAFAAFIAVERRVEASGRAPLVTLRLFRERPFAVGMAVVIIAYAGINSFFLVLSLTLQDGLGLSALSAGLVYSPLAVAFFLTSLLAGRLSPRYGRHVLHAGAFTTAIGFIASIVLVSALGTDLSAGVMIPTLTVVGAGNGLLMTPLLNSVLSRIGPRDVGAASGVLSTGQQVGGALGVAVIGVLYYGSLGARHLGIGSYAHALTMSMVFNLVIVLSVAALLFALPHTGPRRS